MEDKRLVGAILCFVGGLLVGYAYILYFDAGGGLISEAQTLIWLIPLLIGLPSMFYGLHLLNRDPSRNTP